MTTHNVPAVTTPEPLARPSGSHLLLGLVWDIAVPIALYYCLRAAGVSVFVAPLVGAFLPALTTVVQWLRTRSLGGTAGFVAGTMLLGVAAALSAAAPGFCWPRTVGCPAWPGSGS